MDPVKQEQAKFNEEVLQLKESWLGERFRGIRRAYPAETVVSLRGTFKQSYPAAEQSKKLWDILRINHDNKTATPSFGALDAIQATQMAKHLDIVCVSGWQTCAESGDPQPDLPDYSMNVMPKKVDEIFQAQLFHDRKQYQSRMSMGKELRERVPNVDYMCPIIADAETGFGGITAITKLTKSLIEKGAAGVHIDDQVHGTRGCGMTSAKIVIPASEHIMRLNSVRLQADIMGVDLVIISKTDTESASFISSNIDVKDHMHIIGATKRVKPLIEVLKEAEEAGKAPADLLAIEEKWLADAGLKLYEDAVGDALRDLGKSEELVKQFKMKQVGLSHDNAKKVAKSLGVDPFFDWDLPRTREGYFRWHGGIKCAIDRSLQYSHHADLLWMEAKKPSLEIAEEYATAIHERHPNKMLIYHIPASFNWNLSGLSDEDMGEFMSKLGSMGYVLQMISSAGFHINALGTEAFAKDFVDRGLLAFVDGVQRPEREKGVDALQQSRWAGASYYDEITKAVQNNVSYFAALGKEPKDFNTIARKTPTILRKATVNSYAQKAAALRAASASSGYAAQFAADRRMSSNSKEGDKIQ